jgi:SAM-dependent methyltransferase
MTAHATAVASAGLAFDTLAAEYDAHFTNSQVGRAQRDVVWQEAARVFRDCPSILELNCGTGEDALHFARHGHTVTALDASGEMIARATQRKNAEAPDAPIDLHQLCIEELFALAQGKWDAVFSNFSGLNCVDDLAAVAAQLATRTLPGAPVLICLSTRFCLWETAWYALSGEPRKAIRRWSGSTVATLNGCRVNVHYPTTGAVERAFAPHFRLVASTGIGISVPPSYVEPWMRGRTKLLRLLRRVDGHLCKVAGFRSLGDHVLLHFVREAGQR